MTTIAVVMAPAAAARLFDDRLRARLAEAGEVLGERASFEGFPALERAEVLLSGWGCPPVDAHVVAAAPALRAIVHAAGTVKAHVTDACFRRGIVVSSAAAANAIPVAEFTVAAILLANKRAFRIARRYAEVRAACDWTAEAAGLGNHGKRVGVVGASRVGRRVIELLRPFDLEVALYDPYVTASDAAGLGVGRMDLDALVAWAEVLTLHAPALPSTRHLIDERRLAMLRDGAVLVNTARGVLVDHDALTAELVSGRIDAVIDTTDPEPLPASSPLYELPNVFLTPHIAGAMGAETHRMTELAIEEIERFARGEPFAHGVRREDLERIA